LVRRCRIRRLVVVAGLVLLVGVPTGGLLGVAEPAGATPFRAQTWNVARGNSDIRNAYAKKNGGPGFYQHGLDVIWNAVAYTYGNPVWSFSLQEVCRAMVTEIAWALNNPPFHNYQRYYADFGKTSQGTACNNFGSDYGNGLLAIGVAIQGEDWQFRSHPPGVTHEPKAIRCVKMMSWGFNTLNCSTHLTPSDRDNDTYKYVQASEAHSMTTLWAEAHTALQITGGDFNINFTPPLSGMRDEFRRWYWGWGWHAHDEAWVDPWVNRRRPTHISERMIDYVWVRHPQFERFGFEGIWCEPLYEAWHNRWLLISDHRLCPGRFWHGG